MAVFQFYPMFIKANSVHRPNMTAVVMGIRVCSARFHRLFLGPRVVIPLSIIPRSIPPCPTTVLLPSNNQSSPALRNCAPSRSGSGSRLKRYSDKVAMLRYLGGHKFNENMAVDELSYALEENLDAIWEPERQVTDTRKKYPHSHCFDTSDTRDIYEV